MLELVKAGGWPMIPLLLLSAVGLAIIVERFWALRRKAVLPPGLGEEVRAWAARGKLDAAHIDSLRRNSPLGALLAAALDVRHRPREEIRERVEWVPASGVNRIGAMVENRLEWTISRQRLWGSPITILRPKEPKDGIPEYYPSAVDPAEL